MMISRYLQERLIYRISISPYHKRFILKGGALLYAHDGLDARPTLDIDFMASRINNDSENICRIMREICSIEYPEDGVIYDPSTIVVNNIAIEKEYHGVRVHVTAHLESVLQRMSMDIGFGDILTPAPAQLSYPTLLDTVPQAEILAYSMETVVAEKFEAMISLSIANSRMKDFFDVYKILLTMKLDPDTLSQAIKATFVNRETVYEEGHPLFTEDFFTDVNRNSFWNGFLRKIKYQENLEFVIVGKLIQTQLLPY